MKNKITIFLLLLFIGSSYYYYSNNNGINNVSYLQKVKKLNEEIKVIKENSKKIEVIDKKVNIDKNIFNSNKKLARSLFGESKYKELCIGEELTNNSRAFIFSHILIATNRDYYKINKIDKSKFVDNKCYILLGNGTEVSIKGKETELALYERDITINNETLNKYKYHIIDFNKIRDTTKKEILRTSFRTLDEEEKDHNEKQLKEKKEEELKKAIDILK